MSTFLQVREMPVTILPLGDSITSNGFENFSYRYFLWQQFMEAETGTSPPIDFVGTLQDGYNGNPDWPVDGDGNVLFDRDHEGHWGWRIDSILDEIDDWLDTLQQEAGGPTSGSRAVPDIALVHLGTNDCIQDPTSAEEIVEKLGLLVAKFHNFNLSTEIYISQLIPTTTSVETQMCLDQVNSRLAEPNVFEDFSPSWAFVEIVNMDGFDAEEDTWDGLHPNAQGSELMATQWFNAMVFTSPLLASFQASEPPIAQPLPITTSPLPTPSPSTMITVMPTPAPPPPTNDYVRKVPRGNKMTFKLGGSRGGAAGAVTRPNNSNRRLVHYKNPNQEIKQSPEEIM